MIARAVTRTFLTVAVAGLALPALAQSDEGTLKYRQKVMSGIGADMGSIGDILKYGLPQKDAIAAHAELIARRADLVAAAFERNVSAGPTDAKPEIWQKPDEFREKTQAMKTAAQELAAAAASGDGAAVGPKMKALGDACGGCHEAFRKPKEESYKRVGAQ